MRIILIFAYLVNFHHIQSEALISNIVTFTPGKGLSIAYAPLAEDVVSSLVECGVLFAINPCCLDAFFDENINDKKMCQQYDIPMSYFLTHRRGFTHIFHKHDKGRLQPLVLLKL